ncbi:hypothetical protein [Roseicyclus sp.]
MTISLGLVGIGMIAFIARWIAWRRENAQKQENPDHITDEIA